MRKSAQKSAPPNLGTKRGCPQCSTKFYDFGKEDLVCPKCDAKFNPNDAKSMKAPEPKKKAKEGPEAALMESDDIVVEGGDAFESVDDLEDEEDEIVEDIADEDGEDF